MRCVSAVRYRRDTVTDVQCQPKLKVGGRGGAWVPPRFARDRAACIPKRKKKKKRAKRIKGKARANAQKHRKLKPHPFRKKLSTPVEFRFGFCHPSIHPSNTYLFNSAAYGTRVHRSRYNHKIFSNTYDNITDINAENDRCVSFCALV